MEAYFRTNTSRRKLRHVPRVDYSMNGLTAAGLASPRRTKSISAYTPAHDETAASFAHREGIMPVSSCNLMPSVLAPSSGNPWSTRRSRLRSRGREDTTRNPSQRRVSFSDSVHVKYFKSHLPLATNANKEEDFELRGRDRTRRTKNSDSNNGLLQGCIVYIFIWLHRFWNALRAVDAFFGKTVRMAAAAITFCVHRFWNALRAVDAFFGKTVRMAAAAISFCVQWLVHLVVPRNGDEFSTSAGKTANMLPFSREQMSSTFTSVIRYGFLFGLICWMLWARYEHVSRVRGTKGLYERLVNPIDPLQFLYIEWRSFPLVGDPY